MLGTAFEGGRLDPSKLDVLPVHLAFFPQGWTSSLELQVLYNLARHGTGDLLEVGSWIGRSTTALALGVRDRADQAPQHERHFDVVDLGLSSIAEFEQHMSMPITSIARSERDLRPIMAPGGVMGVLIDNLRVRNLLGHVTALTKGGVDKVPLRSSYGVIFCDAVHNAREIAIAGPVIARVAAPGAWLICDDLRTPDLIDAFEKHVRFAFKVRLHDHDPGSKAVVGRLATP